MTHIRIKSVAYLLGSILPMVAIAAPHWEYQGHHGATHWADIDPAYEKCAVGLKQSPINIHKTVKFDLPKLVFHYGVIAPSIWNNGHTVQVNVPGGNTLEVGNQSYELLQFHFHLPSEEAIHGKRFPMVAHFVHRNAAGQLGVVGILIQAGKATDALTPVFAHLPRPGEKITVDDLSLDLSALLPKSLGYYSFEGSLTTPPCSEGVDWMVLKEAISLKPSQIAAFKKLIGHNARPIQATHDRSVRESQ
jgi:carbonic anhydrase